VVRRSVFHTGNTGSIPVSDTCWPCRLEAGRSLLKGGTGVRFSVGLLGGAASSWGRVNRSRRSFIGHNALLAQRKSYVLTQRGSGVRISHGAPESATRFTLIPYQKISAIHDSPSGKGGALIRHLSLVRVQHRVPFRSLTDRMRAREVRGSGSTPGEMTTYARGAMATRLS
jgi:hypothetical protein